MAGHPILYEINTRCWLAELSEKAGHRVTLADVPDSQFDDWLRRGFTHIWLMGVWSLGERGLAWSRRCHRGPEHLARCHDIAGSPYSICGYTVSRKLGGETALKRFRRKLNGLGLKLVLDFVPNHTALDHPWVREHPEYYLTSLLPREGTIKPYRSLNVWYALGNCGHGSPWVDTLQLNYFNPKLREAMTEELLAVAARCDGVRCDMAMLVLREVFAKTWSGWKDRASRSDGEFWSEAIATVRRDRPDFLFLAEVYWDLEDKLQQLGFDFTYDKRLYDHLIAHDGPAAAKYLRSLTPEFIARSAHFLENHDEPRISSLLSFEEHRAAALLVAALPGMRFFHEGQMAGFRQHANVHFGRRIAEPANPATAQFYEILFRALNTSAAARGEPSLLTPEPAWDGNPTHSNFVLVQWTAGESVALVAVNLASHPGQCCAPVQLPLGTGETCHFRDLLNGEIYERSSSELRARGLYIDLPALGFHLLQSEQIRARLPQSER